MTREAKLEEALRAGALTLTRWADALAQRAPGFWLDVQRKLREQAGDMLAALERDEAT
jgi:hypothetical protein